MKTIVIDTREMFNRDAAHSYLARKLSFPEYYGNNLDALHDCLMDISEPTHIILYHFPNISTATSSYLCSLLRTLKDSAQENKYLTLSFDVDSHDLR